MPRHTLAERYAAIDTLWRYVTLVTPCLMLLRLRVDILSAEAQPPCHGCAPLPLTPLLRCQRIESAATLLTLLATPLPLPPLSPAFTIADTPPPLDFAMLYAPLRRLFLFRHAYALMMPLFFDDAFTRCRHAFRH